MNNTIPLHGHYIRNLLANKKIARGYIKNYLPSFINSNLNIATLTQLPVIIKSKVSAKVFRKVLQAGGATHLKNLLPVSETPTGEPRRVRWFENDLIFLVISMNFLNLQDIFTGETFKIYYPC